MNQLNTPIRVLHVLGKLHRGGAETMVMNLYRNIDKEKIQFDFVVHTEKVEAYENEIHNFGGKIFRIPAYKGYNHFEYIHAWKELLSNHPEFKIIHGHVRSTASIYMLIAKQYNRITISHSHSTSNGNGIAAVIKRIMQYPIRYIADYFFAASEQSGKWLYGDQIIQKKNFLILKNSINIQDFEYNEGIRKTIREKLNLENQFVLGHVGRLHESKNHIFLIEIFNEILKINTNSKLILVGKGNLIDVIREKAILLNLEENILFLGERSDIADLIQAMDVFVFPSIYEGLPVSLIEAQASGIPIVASDSITKNVNITNLITFISLSSLPSFWAKQIIKYKDNYPRENYSVEIKKAGYDIKTNAKKLERFYTRIVK